MRRGYFHLVFFAALILAAAAYSQISPGKLAKPHSKLEGIANCTKCHELGEEVTNDRCLACHTAVSARVKDGKGFHASAEVRTKKCASCHFDHQGVEFEMIHWGDAGQKGFNHANTGWPLLGAHRKHECAVCHVARFQSETGLTESAGVNIKKTFLGLSGDCASCHADEHGEQMSNDCASCHNSDAWTPAPGFSHDKARYALVGKHAQVGCEKCHTSIPVQSAAATKLIEKKNRVGLSTVYRELNFQNCVPCHTDPHENKFGQDCKSCHTTSGFKEVVTTKFNHALTKFPLKGKHVSVACVACHKSGSMTADIAYANCADCHKDAHRGQFGDRADKGKCESCHTVDGFIPAVYTATDHEKSRYPLTGSHLAVPCFACHTQVADEKNKAQYAKFDFADLTCKFCHRDIHAGEATKWVQESGCEYCHTTETWHKTKFDHNLSRFPLQGKHTAVTCVKCHTREVTGTDSVYVKLKQVPMECASCHDDIHKGQFTRAEMNEVKALCSRCHTPNSWKELQFDHNRDSRFALDGAHAKVACIACHKPVTTETGQLFVQYRPLGRECADCHSGGTVKP